MGLSIRSQRLMFEHRRRRDAERRAAEQAAAALAEAYRATFYDRQRAADFLGISVHRLKRLMGAGLGPVCVKRGEAKQARCLWPIDELRAYRADPEGYVARRHADAGRRHADADDPSPSQLEGLGLELQAAGENGLGELGPDHGGERDGIAVAIPGGPGESLGERGPERIERVDVDPSE
jgi:hypothetical protein